MIASQKNGKWCSTQENAFVLVAMDHYFHKFEKYEPNYTAKVWLRNMFGGEHKFVGRSSAEVLFSIPMKEVAKEPGLQYATIAKQGRGALYYRIGLRYAPRDLFAAVRETSHTPVCC